jgi:E3 ubiquitin-protein ligase HUWE1
LLDSSSGNRASVNQSRGSRQTQRIVAGGSNDFIQSIDDILGGGSMHVLQHLGIVSRGRGGGPETFRFDVPAGALVNLDRGYVPNRRVNQGLFSAAIRVERAPRPPGQRQGREFDPLLTLQRWTEEMKILHGDFVTERIGKLINHVTLALLPAAVEAAKQAKLREEVEEADRRQQEQTKSAEQEIKAVEEKYGVREAEQPVAESPPSTADAVPAAAPSGEASATPPTPADEHQGEQDQVMEMASPVNIDADTEMVDISGTQLPTAPSTEVEPSMEPHTEAPAESSSAATATSERVTVIIHGSAVDITDTGIDPTFLEALPDDMREEVLNQHVRDQRAARVERPPDSQISSEFLEALPPEIRAEIIQQEAIERARRRAEDAPPGATVATPADIDPASFIASLDPTLRQAVLMDQDDGFIQTLPSHMIAEAGAYRDGLAPRQRLATRGAPSRTMPPGISHARKFSPLHDAIQLLDKAGIAVLVRLLFFPQVLKKTLLFKALVHLCENAKTRTELFNLLLNILQDGTGDLAAVDKSFSQLSVKSSKPQTPKSAGKQKAGSEYLAGFTLPASHVEAVPDLIAQRCLEALSYIVSANDLSSLFFLTEHELPFGLRKAVTKKGKGREKQIPQTHYPIVLLLGLLDRQSLLRTPAIMEAVVSLLATVTRPLTSLKDREKTDKVPDPGTITSVITAVSDRAPPTFPTDGSSPTNIQVDSTTRLPEPSTNESTSLNTSMFISTLIP